MLTNQTIFTHLFIRSISIIVLILCFGFLLGCSGDVNGSQWHLHGREFRFNDNDVTVEKIIQEDISVQNQISVNVEATNGEILITGQVNTDRILVNARIFVSSDTQADADLHLDDIDILVTEGTHEISIETVQPVFDGRGYRVEYDIIVPDSFEVVASQVNGDIIVFNIQNSVELVNENGNIIMSEIVGGALAEVENGFIEAHVILPVNEVIDLNTNNGSLDLSIPVSTSADFSAFISGIGEIDVYNLDIMDSSGTKKLLKGILGNGEGTISLMTAIGDIEVLGFERQ
ncbi:MAG: hypothetical protein KJO26_04560 [Deltaproteobacteria bacterium]|nr:hypothetical protein [Deltaproteobacteria bacterium]NNK84813.1 hypothetical protein [Desulfobacterales bacterium]